MLVYECSCVSSMCVMTTGQPRVATNTDGSEMTDNVPDVKDELTFYQYKVCTVLYKYVNRVVVIIIFDKFVCLFVCLFVLIILSTLLFVIQPFNVVLVNKVRSNSDVILGKATAKKQIKSNYLHLLFYLFVTFHLFPHPMALPPCRGIWRLH